MLPILLIFLSSKELGLWYSFLAVSNLTQLFEFGFNPTFARNIVYVLSGATTLSKEGSFHKSEKIDAHLLASLLKTAKLIYAAIAAAALILVSTLGTLYVGNISADINGVEHWIAWGIFCISILLNLYYLWPLTFLRGFGDIAGENQAKTFAKTIQVVGTLLLCLTGLGLVGAAIAYLISGLSLRLYSMKALSRHSQVLNKAKQEKITRSDIKSVLTSISYLACKDGIVQLSLYSATQGTSIVCSLYLGLEETGAYSLGLQLASAIAQCSRAYIASFYPAYQSAYATHQKSVMREIAGKGISIYWIIAIVAIILVSGFGLPIIRLIKPNTEIGLPLFLALSLYSCLHEQHSIFCSLIVATNRIPYMTAYVISAIGGLILAVLLISGINFGVWGLVISQLVAQGVYNNWRWPRMVLKELDYPLIQVFSDGFGYWKKMLLCSVLKRTERGVGGKEQGERKRCMESSNNAKQ